MFTKIDGDWSWESFFNLYRSMWKTFQIPIFSAAETGGCDFVQKKTFRPWCHILHYRVCFLKKIIIINGACASLKEACTVVLHSGLCPSHTTPTSPSPSPPPLPCSIKSKPITYLKSSHAPPPSAPSTCLDSKGSCAPWESGHMKCSRDLNQPYSFLSENSRRHRVHRGFWKCGSPSPEVKNTHPTEPDCVLCRVLIFMKQHRTSQHYYYYFFFFSVCFTSLYLSLCSVLPKKKGCLNKCRRFSDFG